MNKYVSTSVNERKVINKRVGARSVVRIYTTLCLCSQFQCWLQSHLSNVFLTIGHQLLYWYIVIGNPTSNEPLLWNLYINMYVTVW